MDRPAFPVSLANIEVAAQAIAGAVEVTPARQSRTLSAIAGTKLFLKFENLQFTASFKERGALNRLLSLTEAERKRGVIVNVVGNAADTHDPEYICGVAGNAALAAFTQSLGSVSAKDGIRVVAINPGPVATDRLVGLMKKKALDRTGSADNWQDLFKPLPFGRGASAEEIGAAIAFLASERSAYTSGSVVTIDAGLSARAQAF